MQFEHPIAASLAVVVKGNHVLLVRRRHQPDEGLWGFPGGKIQLGESMIDAAQRELFEETAIEADPYRIEAPLELMGRTPHDAFYHFLLVPVLCLYKVGTPCPGDDALEVDWIYRDELPDLDTFMSFNVLHIALSAIDAAREQSIYGT